MQKTVFFLTLMYVNVYAAQAPEEGWSLNGTFTLCKMERWENKIGVLATKKDGFTFFYCPGAILLQVSDRSTLTLCRFIYLVQQSNNSETVSLAKRLFFKGSKQQAEESAESWMFRTFGYSTAHNVEYPDGSPKCILFIANH